MYENLWFSSIPKLQWRTILLLSLSPWEKRLAASWMDMFISRTNLTRTRMVLWQNTTPVKTSKLFSVVYLLNIFYFPRKNDDMKCYAKVHAVVHMDNNGEEARTVLKTVGHHNADCLPNSAFVQVYLLLWLFFSLFHLKLLKII